VGQTAPLGIHVPPLVQDLLPLLNWPIPCPLAAMQRTTTTHCRVSSASRWQSSGRSWLHCAKWGGDRRRRCRCRYGRLPDATLDFVPPLYQCALMVRTCLRVSSFNQCATRCPNTSNAHGKLVVGAAAASTACSSTQPPGIQCVRSRAALPQSLTGQGHSSSTDTTAAHFVPSPQKSPVCRDYLLRMGANKYQTGTAQGEALTDTQTPCRDDPSHGVVHSKPSIILQVTIVVLPTNMLACQSQPIYPLCMCSAICKGIRTTCMHCDTGEAKEGKAEWLAVRSELGLEGHPSWAPHKPSEEAADLQHAPQQVGTIRY
jgi:hypothetical protein